MDKLAVDLHLATGCRIIWDRSAPRGTVKKSVVHQREVLEKIIDAVLFNRFKPVFHKVQPNLYLFQVCKGDQAYILEIFAHDVDLLGKKIASIQGTMMPDEAKEIVMSAQHIYVNR